MKNQIHFAFILCLLAGGVAGCSQRSVGGVDTNTNWLDTCSTNAECGDLACLCGVCTKECDALADCAGLEAAATCAAAPSCTEVSNVCLAAARGDDAGTIATPSSTGGGGEGGASPGMVAGGAGPTDTPPASDPLSYALEDVLNRDATCVESEAGATTLHSYRAATKILSSTYTPATSGAASETTFNIQLDDAGLWTWREEVRDGDALWRQDYTYDERGNLTYWDYDQQDIEYVHDYDAEGRLVATEAVHTLGGSVQRTTIETYEYDAGGRLERWLTDRENDGEIDGTLTMLYDEDGRLELVKTVLSTAPETSREVQFVYDEQNRLVEARYDGVLPPVGFADPDGMAEQVTSWVYREKSDVARFESEGSLTDVPADARREFAEGCRWLGVLLPSAYGYPSEWTQALSLSGIAWGGR